jgi:hypothetical protein
VAIPHRRFGTAYRSHLQRSLILDSCPLKVGPIGYPETSARNCHYALRDIPEERSSLSVLYHQRYAFSVTDSVIQQNTTTPDHARTHTHAILHYQKAILFFMFCWSCISVDPCDENQLDALFILSIFRQSTSICFRHICSPSSGGILYIYNNWYVLCFLVDCLLAGLGWNVFIIHTLYFLSSCLTVLTVLSSALKWKSLRFNFFFFE